MIGSGLALLILALLIYSRRNRTGGENTPQSYMNPVYNEQAELPPDAFRAGSSSLVNILQGLGHEPRIYAEPHLYDSAGTVKPGATDKTGYLVPMSSTVRRNQAGLYDPATLNTSSGDATDSSNHVYEGVAADVNPSRNLGSRGDSNKQHDYSMSNGASNGQPYYSTPNGASNGQPYYSTPNGTDYSTPNGTGLYDNTGNGAFC